MTRQDIAHLTFKVVGLYCIILAIPLFGWFLDIVYAYVFSLPGLRNIDSEGPLIGSALAAPAMLGGLGAYLMVRSRKLAKRVFPDGEPQGPPERILAVHALTFSVVGLFIIAESLPKVLSLLMFIVLQWDEITQAGYHPYIRGVAEPLLQMTVGIALFFGSHGLVRIWSRLRYAGIRDKLGVCLHCGYDLTGNTSGACPECGTQVAR